jgi:hypothetical protein
MAAPISPAKKLSYGKDTWWLVPAVANKNAPTAAEVNAATGLNMAGVLLADFEGMSSTTAKVTIPAVMMETSVTEVSGATTHSMADMQVTFQPQAAAGSPGKKAWELVSSGSFVGFAIRRQDVDATAGDATTGQFVDVVPVEVDQPIPGRTSAGPDGIYVFTAPVSITGDPAFNKAVAA